MRKNVASQVTPSVQLRSPTDGSAVTTGTTTVYVKGDTSAQGAGGGTVTHAGNGSWYYQPTQAETNYSAVAFTFVNASAMSETISVYTVGQDFTAAQLDANTIQISGDATAADNLEAAADGTGYNLGGGAVVAASVTGSVGGNVAGSVASVTAPVTLAADAVNAAALAADALAEIKAEVEAVLATTARAELTSVPAANASLADKLSWITLLLRNKRTQDDTTETVYAADGTTPVATSTKTVASGTLTRSEYI